MNTAPRVASHSLTDFYSQVFDGAEHSERAWRERVHIPLEFLLGPAR